MTRHYAPVMATINPTAVLFDFAGTLFDDIGVMRADRLIAHARTRGLALGEREAAEIIARTLAYVDAPERLADKAGCDLSADAHRSVWTRLMAAAGPFPSALVDALYACMTDTGAWLPYPDTLDVLRRLAAAGVPVGVLSNVGWDIRPTFNRVDAPVDRFVLSYEHGVAKPDPAAYRIGCELLATPCERVLFVGDNPATDGAAVHAGLPAYLLPAARDAGRPRGLAAVLRLLDVA
jgi:FMN phosphatase YigB (HAD superfamily)